MLGYGDESQVVGQLRAVDFYADINTRQYLLEETSLHQEVHNFETQFRRRDGSIIDVPHHLGERLLAAFPSELVQQIAAELGVPIDRVNLELIAAPAEV